MPMAGGRARRASRVPHLSVAVLGGAATVTQQGLSVLWEAVSDEKVGASRRRAVIKAMSRSSAQNQAIAVIGR